MLERHCRGYAVKVIQVTIVNSNLDLLMKSL